MAIELTPERGQGLASASGASPQPVPCNLDDLPMPPEVAAEAQRHALQRGLRGKWRRELEEQLKLQFYFGGLCVSYIRTSRGIVVVAAGRSGSQEYQEQLARVTPEQRADLILAIPSRWIDDETQL